MKVILILEIDTLNEEITKKVISDYIEETLLNLFIEDEKLIRVDMFTPSDK